MIEMFIFIGLWLFCFGISFFNAVAFGLAWTESQIIGGWQKITNYAAAIMSMAGFSWCYLSLLAIACGYWGILSEAEIELMLNLGYLIWILPVIGSGIAITIDSWAYTLKNKSLLNFGVSSYNTFATSYNILHGLNTIPEAFSNIMLSMVSGGDSDDNNKGLIVLAIVIFVAIAGILTTIIIAKWIAKQDYHKSIDKVTKNYA